MTSATNLLDRRPPVRPLPGFDARHVRRDFPLLMREDHGEPIVYLDNAATGQKPRSVIDAINRYYLTECANIHRGAHWLGGLATHHYEEARGKVREFIGADRVRWESYGPFQKKCNVRRSPAS